MFENNRSHVITHYKDLTSILKELSQITSAFFGIFLTMLHGSAG